MRNKIRLEKLEAKLLHTNNGLRAVMPLDALYSDEPNEHLFWTDENIKGVEALYNEGYQKALHPDGLKPTIDDM
ncbi:MAG: hypothetical protein U9R27_07735 [Campylobacterota bacterium]|nr:hypothetical protein [Campylobacterota bacterium]